MSFFSRILDAVFGKEYLEPKSSIAELIEYLPPGDLDALWRWQKRNLPYRSDDGDGHGLDNYNGGDLTLLDGHGDCESLAAVFSEVIRAWNGWRSSHLRIDFTNRRGEAKAHDVATFCTPAGKLGWMEFGEYGGYFYGGLDRMKDFYREMGWRNVKFSKVNDMGVAYE